MDFLGSLVIAIKGGVLHFLSLLPIFAAMLGLETFAPVIGARVALAGRVRNLVLWFAYVVCGFLLCGLIAPVIAPLHIHPLLPNWTFPAGVLVALVAGDFAYYWFHRFEHRFLWRWHAVHHSPRELHGLSGYHHPAESVLQTLFWTVPMGVLMPNPFGPPLLFAITMTWDQYAHSNTALGLGRGRVILADNRFHRIHHSLTPEHWDHNFGVLFPWWDMMFGTAWMPAQDEWPEVGVPEYGEIMGVGELLTRPVMRTKAPVMDFYSHWRLNRAHSRGPKSRNRQGFPTAPPGT
ncbi:MAG TPA: sterol desaturase family protein [Caulobacteraceae bacterium]|jgi:sterol desaturase/sphingolipid hydroxylase (fatty acid hydroxylase superfamily)